MLENILDKLQTKNISLLVTIDEVDPTPEIKNFISLYQLLIRENYQISLIMTGLPNKLSELQNDYVLTFLLRSARMQLSSLDLLSIKHSYQDTFAKKGIAISDDVLVAMVKKTKGYAYSFQLLGYLLWEIADKKITFATLEQIQGEYLATLSRNVYYKVLQELSPVDHSFVIAMAKAPTPVVTTAYLQQELGKPKNYLSMYRKRLLDAQLIKSPARGMLEFTLPYFKEYILENLKFYA